MTAVLRLDQVSVAVGGTELLRQVSFSLGVGEVMAVVGPNGAGKTTMLRAVVGELPVSGGALTLCGRPHHHWRLQERARRLAVLPQASTLNFPFTVAEVVALGRSPHSTGRAVDEEIIRAALAALDIGHLRDRLYPQLSGGEKQRTQLARVMVQIWRAEDIGERLLVLDEPTASLDLGHQQQLMQRVRAFASDGAAVLMVLHDLNLALRFADRLLALHQGAVAAEGPCAEVLTTDLLQRLYGARVELMRHPHDGRPVVIL